MKWLIWLGWLSLGVSAQDLQVTITGKGDQSLVDGKIIYEDYFKIQAGDVFLLTSDWASYDTQTGIVVATGNVKIDYHTEMGLVEVTAHEVAFDLNRQSGEFSQVTAQFGDDFFFDGARLDLVSRDEIHIYRGRLTACNQPTPPWSVNLGFARIVRAGYAVVKGASFRAMRVPVFYFPYLLIPVFQERRSGLLTPDTGSSSRNGRYFSQPFYWAPRRDFDMTFTPAFFDKAGLRLELEARYRPAKAFGGILNGSYIDDMALDDDGLVVEDGEAVSPQRFRVNWEHDQRLLKGDLLVDLEEGSDFQVDRDFFRESQASRLRDYRFHGQYHRMTGHGLLSLEFLRKRRILVDIDRVSELADLPSLRYFYPTRSLGAGFYLRGQGYLNLIQTEQLGPANLDESIYRVGLDLELSRTADFGPYVHSRFGAGLTRARYDGADSRDSDSLGGPYAFFEILGPRLTRHYGEGDRRLQHVVDAGLVSQIGTREDESFFPDVEFDELDIRIADGRSDLRTTWQVQSRFFSRRDALTRPVFETVIRQAVDWASSTQSEPIELDLRYAHPRGYRATGNLSYDPRSGRLDTLSLYAGVGRKNLKGYGGYVRRQEEGAQNQNSFIGTTEWFFLNQAARLKVVLDYDFEQGDFKSQEFRAGYRGSCMGIQVGFVKSPFSTGGDREWYQLAVSFRNLGEVGGRF